MTDTSIADLFRAGSLDAAVDAATRTVRDAPGNVSARILLAELLLFTGGFERADRTLDASARLDPAAATVVAEFRQLLRAEIARRQVRLEGRAPDLLAEPDATMRHLLRALAALREGDKAGAAAETEAAEQARAPVPALVDEKKVSDLRDLDDLCAGHVELLTTTGKCFWIDTARIAVAEFAPIARPRDLFWRRVEVTVDGGPDGVVYLPMLYVGTETHEDRFRLGRETGWTDTAPVRGFGQRVFLVGDEAVPAGELRSIQRA